MSRIGHNFDAMHELPIPEDVQVDAGWPAQLVEMADHIGPYLTLLIVERWGGQYVYVPLDPNKSPFRDVIGERAAAIMSRIYGREMIAVPTGRKLMPRIRRAPLLAAVRRGELSGNEAARRLGMGRSYLAHLINSTDEGLDQGEPPCRRPGLPGQLDLFGEEEEA